MKSITTLDVLVENWKRERANKKRSNKYHQIGLAKTETEEMISNISPYFNSFKKSATTFEKKRQCKTENAAYTVLWDNVQV